MSLKSKTFTLGYMFIGLIIVWFGGFMYFSHHINHYDTNAEEKTDAVVVLTGGRNRIAKGIKIYNAGKAERLFISGVSKSTTLEDLEQRAGLEIINKQNVELGYVATTTIGNALEVKNWVEKNNISSIRLVTSNYHVPRSMAEL
ncbi:MAG: YdcF family protein, partial [Alphaproteobacteria bacterium]|nr:YdcF family protein [Alphaproteobacteria bacterium]